MLSSELEYDLPDELIATQPAAPRDSARLMVIFRDEDRIEHHHVRDLPRFLNATDTLIFNDSRVLPAHFPATRTATGGRITGLYLESHQDVWRVMLESRGKLRAGEKITLTDQAHLELIAPEGGGEWSASLRSEHTTFELLHQIGSPPLPPYIRKRRSALGTAPIQPSDIERYNTVYAAADGSVAAPTAGLHFTQDLLAQLDQSNITRHNVTLHVGLGTFAPVRTESVKDHPIHSEWIQIPRQTIKHVRSAEGRMIPVGTTSVRAIESLPDDCDDQSDFTTNTNLFITDQGFPFRYTDALMTNFHLPHSTLLALVAALPGVGLERLKDWYRIAIEKEYRFYSYGDAMLIL